MTTETLKPFILAPRCADNSSLMRPNSATRSRSCNLTSIILSVLAMFLTWLLLGFSIWHFQRTAHLETEIKQLDKVVLNMQRRLGLTILDDEGDYGKENNPVFVDKPTILDYDEDKLIDEKDDEDFDDEDYETEFDYEEFRKKLAAMNFEDEIDNGDEIEKEDDSVDINANGDEDKDEESEEEMDISDDGDLYSDFSKFNSTRKKTSARKPRSIPPENFGKEHEVNDKSKIEGITNYDEKESRNKQRKRLVLRLPYQRSKGLEGQIEHKISGKEQMGKHYHRRHIDRRYKNAIVKNGGSHIFSAKSARRIQTPTNTPAAHFHLNRKIPDRYASIKVDSYSGDMYIGHPSWSNEIDVDNYFKVENGILTVHEPGLYYVYAQVCYNNTHDQNGFVIFHGYRPFLQCLNTVPTNMPHKIHTCHTSGLIYLKENETIHLRDFHSDRNVILKDANNRSYFGLIKI